MWRGLQQQILKFWLKKKIFFFFYKNLKKKLDKKKKNENSFSFNFQSLPPLNNI